MNAVLFESNETKSNNNESSGLQHHNDTNDEIDSSTLNCVTSPSPHSNNGMSVSVSSVSLANSTTLAALAGSAQSASNVNGAANNSLNNNGVNNSYQILSSNGNSRRSAR